MFLKKGYFVSYVRIDDIWSVDIQQKHRKFFEMMQIILLSIWLSVFNLLMYCSIRNTLSNSATK